MTLPTSARHAIFESPVGPLALRAGPAGLEALRFVDRDVDERPATDAQPGDEGEDASVLDAATHQLREYFAGERREFDLPLAPTGTEFQLRVWQELRRIPYGETISYGELARRIGNPRASRAVGLANGANPIAILVPCHRVVGADGRLTGFGGGLRRKATLLAIESPLAFF